MLRGWLDALPDTVSLNQPNVRSNCLTKPNGCSEELNLLSRIATR